MDSKQLVERRSSARDSIRSEYQKPRSHAAFGVFFFLLGSGAGRKEGKADAEREGAALIIYNHVAFVNLMS